MSAPAPLPPRRGDAAPVGPGLPPESFTGGRRDVPAPREFIPAMARDLGNLVPASEKAAGDLPADDTLDKLGDFFAGAQEENEGRGASGAATGRSGLSAELSSLFTAFEPAAAPESPLAEVSSMTGETANSLSSLASALLSEPPSPARPAAAINAPAAARLAGPQPSPTSAAELLETTKAAQFSLADLAGRLSSKLNTPAKTTAIDLLDDGSEDAETTAPSQAMGMDLDWGDLVSPAAPAAESKPPTAARTKNPDTNWGDLLADSASDFPVTVEAAAQAFGELTTPPPSAPPAPRSLPLPAKPGGLKFAARVAAPTEIPAPPAEVEPAFDRQAETETRAEEDVENLSEPHEFAAPYDSGSVFPIPRTQPPPMPVLAESPELASAGGVLILMLGGAALALMGVLLACTLPMLWLGMKGQDAWTQHVAWAAIIVRAALAGGLMTLGMGSLLQKRWAPPLIHATGWVGALFASLGIAGITWHWAGGDLEAAASSTQLAADLMLLVPSLAVNLVLILLYQRPDLSEICRTEDPETRWTEALPVPGLMVFISGVVFFAGGISMLAFNPAFPLPGPRILTGSTAAAAWVVLSVLGAGASFLSIRHHRSAPWLLCSATLLLAAGPAIAGFSGSGAWSDFLTALGKSTGSSTSAVPALLAGLCPFPFILVLAMARRAFSFPSPP